MGRQNAPRWRAVARWAALALLVPLGLYAVAGLVGGAIPANRGWRPPAQGVTIFVETNGVHTGIVVPKVAAGVDWRPLARPEHLRDPRYARYDHLSFGWGERTFYLETPTWWDVKPGTVLAAMIGSERTLVHLDHVPRPRAEPEVRPIVLTEAQYRRLAAFLSASVAPGGERLPGYFGYDAFYAAKGRYSGLRTCNEWTGAALRHAGVRVGAWTPFTRTVMWWF
jgi:uncharacterized protein (TIGR02117 family)